MTDLAFVALGSNIDPEEHLPRAVALLAALGRLPAVSMVYQNPAIGPVPAPEFLNAAVLLETGLDAGRIQAQLRRIEAALGRVRTSDRYAPRVIDLDLCLLGSQVGQDAGLVLPDPDILVRPYLAVTLAELAPEFRHPVTDQPLSAIADGLRAGATLKARPEVAARLRQAAGMTGG